MEHRCTERITGDLKVLIHRYNQPIAIGRIKNGSRLGVFVETEFADIGCEQQLRLEIVANRQYRQPLITMNALVIHKTEKGFGAELDLDSFEQNDLFMKMLRGDFSTSASVDETSFAVVANG
ncbi:hypothetical protein [Cellvibrio sp.]|uniref:hypothetical protein n=1 Tax=Cellvibrio sp. TaxID=1965322 RepID=UPI0039647C42